jgi:poly-beta-1,6-N-acetyl-D-glucosamine biosynthesis protein PgaD
MRPLIIERPELQSVAQRYGYVSVTLVCWFLWLYLFVPLLSLGGWVLGGSLVYEQLILELDNPLMTDRLTKYVSFIAIFSAVYLGWALYNFLRWRGVERRKSVRTVSADDLSTRFNLEKRRIRQLQFASKATVTNDELRHLLNPESNDLSTLLDDDTGKPNSQAA